MDSITKRIWEDFSRNGEFGCDEDFTPSEHLRALGIAFDGSTEAMDDIIVQIEVETGVNWF